MKNYFKKIKDTKSYFISLLIILAIILIISTILAISLGAVKINFITTYKVIIAKIFNINSLLDDINKSTQAIIWEMRAPRVLLGLIAGSGLAICGCIIQATVNNPISEPYILGISSGATFGATLIIMLGLSMAASLVAFLGALGATFLVVIIASRKSKMTSTRLILAGTVVNALFTAFSNFIISISGTSDSIMTIKFWTMGSLTNASWSNIILPSAIIIVAVVFFLTQGRVLNTMMLGDEVAITLGLNLSFYRFVYLTVVAVVTGVLVSTCGVIGFVGLIIPHLCRAFVGTNHKRLIPICAIIGAIFLIYCDIFARVLINNAELPIGIFTALIGAPFFIYIVAKKNYGKE
ncbi:MAG: FecCD family ABC transporter permease [Anaeroplasma sp.]